MTPQCLWRWRGDPTGTEMIICLKKNTYHTQTYIAVCTIPEKDKMRSHTKTICKL